MRPTWADIDLSAVAHNVDVLASHVAPAQMCVVVKADGYGHGAVPIGRAAVEAGASWLAVALVEEGRVLREAGLDVPILVLSEPRPPEMVEVVAHRLTPTVYSGEGLAAAAAAAAQSGSELCVQMKIDTGMGRVGARPTDALGLADAIAHKQSLRLDGVWTHCAIADVVDDPYTDKQLDTYDQALAELEANGHELTWRHAANSAVALAHPRGHYDLVRCGIAVYGIPPSPALERVVDLQPVMRLRSQVSFVKRVKAGDRVSYGLSWEAGSDTTIATVPIGYADGIRRRSSAVGAQVLIGGKRYPMVGTVTMDQLLVDCGDDPVTSGDDVVMLGRQGDDEITAQECASRLDTIGYEVVCAVESRVTRRYI